MLRMKQTASIISTYSADVFGLCSALFELGGMIIMHDASGCNSTYNTHDEPRWYDMDSMVYISALSEMEAVMGDDSKLIDDIVRDAAGLKPKFIAIGGTPIPMMTGTDLGAIARVVEKKTGIPSFGFNTNGMHSYINGVSAALTMLAEHFTDRSTEKRAAPCANIIGLTPLDFSVNGTDESVRAFLRENGFEVISSWAMGSSLDDIKKSGEASVNLVVSAGGIKAAQRLKEIFGTPYIVGFPAGRKFSAKIASDLHSASENGECIISASGSGGKARGVIIGESVVSSSIAASLESEMQVSAKVLCPVDTFPGILRSGDSTATDEDELAANLKDISFMIADPLHRPLCPANVRFIPLPSEAFSGRIFRNNIPNLCDDFDKLKENFTK